MRKTRPICSKTSPLKRFSLFPKKDLIPASDQGPIIEAIRRAETTTSGEVRVFIENHCTYVDSLDRAKEIFVGLQMEATKNRNAVLVYVALKDRQVAVYGDEGIHQKVGSAFWNEEVNHMVQAFKGEHIVQGIATVIDEIGQALHEQFPYNDTLDKNELPDEIIFGH